MQSKWKCVDVVFAAVLMAVSLAAAPVEPGDVDSNAERVDELLRPYDGTHKPGFAVGIIQDGELIYSKGFGMANLDYGIPNTPQTVFRIGSTSKQFTAACIAMLIGEGRLSLDDPVQKHIPELPDYGEPVTVGDLVHHTSGLPDYEDLQPLQGELDDQGNHHADEIVDLISRQSLIFKPKEKWYYSNTNYILMAVIIERVSGLTFAEFARERIFEPLGMKSSRIHDDNTAIISNRAVGYYRSEHGLEVDETITELVGDDGVFTTVEDLLLWDRNFYDDRIGGRDFLQRMHTVGTLDSGEPHEYAFALMIGEHRGLRTVSHGGAFVGFRAQMIRFPEQRFTIVLLANLGNVNPTGLCHEIADIYLGELFEEDAEEPETAESSRSVDLTPEQMQRYVGVFEDGENGMSMEITVEAEALVFKTMGQTLPMEAQEEDVFKVIAPYDITLDYSGLRAENVVILNVVGMGRFEMAPVEFVEVPPEKLAPYVGEFHCERLDTTYRLIMKDDALHIGLPKAAGLFELFPKTPDVFSAGPALRGISLEFRRGADGEITGFGVVVPANRVADVFFEKQAAR
jgi:CubicO group peptidase (beta-lactamase class C family)